MNISRLVRQPLRVGYQRVGGRLNVRTRRFVLVDARMNHLASGSGDGDAPAPEPLSENPLPEALTKDLQPGVANIENSLDVLADEQAFNANSVQALKTCLENYKAEMASVVKTLQDFRAEHATFTAEVRGAIKEQIDLIYVLSANENRPGPALICYPKSFAAGGPLPRTHAEARKLSGNDSIAALKALEGAPGLHPLPANSSPAVCKKHFLYYLGISA